MEGNECYKFSTIRTFVDFTSSKPISLAMDIGANVGDMSLLMHQYFPSAWIYGFEPVREYFEIAKQKLRNVPNALLSNVAVTNRHIFEDYFGERRRSTACDLVVCKAKPEAGAGWMGGSAVVTPDDAKKYGTKRYEVINQTVCVRSFDEVVEEILRQRGADEIDLVKIDCEGCELSVFGSCTDALLKKVRFIVGEYHGLARFYEVMEKRLFRTHKVNLIGDAKLGAFFAERLDGEKDGVLKFNNDGMLRLRPSLCPKPITWHIFNREFVAQEERWFHALS